MSKSDIDKRHFFKAQNVKHDYILFTTLELEVRKKIRGQKNLKHTKEITVQLMILGSGSKSDIAQ